MNFSNHWAWDSFSFSFEYLCSWSVHINFFFPNYRRFSLIHIVLFWFSNPLFQGCLPMLPLPYWISHSGLFECSCLCHSLFSMLFRNIPSMYIYILVRHKKIQRLKPVLYYDIIEKALFWYYKIGSYSFLVVSSQWFVPCSFFF